MKRILFFTLLNIFNLVCIKAQSLEGKVIDKEGTPLIDAYLFTNEGQLHAHTNDVGVFLCEGLEVGDTINVSYLGYETKVLRIESIHFDEPVVITLNERYFDLGQVVVSNNVRSLNQLTKVDLLVNPVNSSQDILRKVPGLFIGQHAGGGKAEQIFLRGFDIDHGTDIGITVDGLPVNMVSHAHGQGYADLHFLIPETVERIDFGKGPYYAERGNFNTAGYVDFQTKKKLDNSLLGIEYGQFNTSRLVGLFDLLGQAEKHHAYIASEYLLTDGPVESPQNFNRFNLMGKYVVDLPNNDQLSILASHFTSKWDASGQIPVRAVQSGLISRFGSIDDTEGGETSRTNFLVQHTKNLNKHTFVKSRAFYSKYDFQLFSNFTFFLDDPVNGDQIMQHEDRQIFGLESVVYEEHPFEAFDLSLQTGIGLRYDLIDDNELSHTVNRKTTLEQMAFGNVNETNMYGFVNMEFKRGDWLINPGVRLDYFKFDYTDGLASVYEGQSESKSILSPKLNFLYNPSHHWQFFLKTGKGFHSNDSRVVVAQGAQKTLPAAYGADLGAIWKPIPRMWMNMALWGLYLEQEFVYVGDAAIVEPSGQTRRMGIEAGIRYQAADYIFIDADVNYTYARAEDSEAQYIPLAPDLTAMSGIAVKLPIGLESSLRFRYLKDRPANEDNSLIAEGYFLTDFNFQYHFKNLTFGIVIENLFDVAWNEAQFATESRLQNELEPVEEIHFTPGVPFFMKARVNYLF